MPRGGLFSNPLWDFAAAAQIGSNVALSNKAAQQQAMQPDQTSLRFANQAYLTGQIADKLPRAPGLFSDLGVKMHLLSPDITARPKDYADEIAGIKERRKEQEETLGKEIDWNTKIGQKNWENLEQLPALRDMTMFATGGSPTLGLTEPPLREQAIQALNQERGFRKEQELFRDRMSLFEGEMHMEELNRRLEEPIKGSQKDLKATYLRSAAAAAGHEDILDKLENNNWDHYNRHHPTYQFRDQNFKIVDPSKLYKTPAEALADKVHLKVLMNPQQVKDAGSTDALISNVQDMRDNVLPHVLAHTRGKTPLAADAAKLWHGFTNTVERTNPYVAEYHKRWGMAMEYAKSLQNYHGTAREVNAVLYGNFPNSWDSLEEGQKKADDLIRSIRIAGGWAVGKGADAGAADSAKRDFYSDIGSPETEGGGLSTSIMGPGGSVVPPMPPPPPGLSAVEGIAGGMDEGGEGGRLSTDSVGDIINEFKPAE